MPNNLEWRTGEYVIRLRGRGRAQDFQWIIELEFFAKGKGKAVLHTETNRVRAEGVYYYLTDHVLMACKLAEEKIGQANFFEAEESEKPGE